MKLTTLLFLLVPFLVFSQEILQKEITTDADFSIYDMVQLPDNGFLACGSASSSANDSIYAVLVKFDPGMEVEWSRRYSMLNKDYFRCITPAGDGNYLVGGTSRYEFAKDYGGNLYKMDAGGNIIWDKLYAKNYDDLTLGIFPQPDYSLVMVIRHGVFGEPTKIIHTDSTGLLLGQFNLGTVNPDMGLVADAAAGDDQGNCYIAGSAPSSVTGKYGYFIARITGMSVAWYREYSFGREYAYLNGITVLSDGNVAVTGSMADTVYSNVNYTGVMKVSQADGSVVWAREVKQAQAYNQTGYGLIALENAALIVCGQANTANGFQAFAAKLDAGGSLDWAREYGSGTYNVFTFGLELPDNRLVLGGKNALGGGTYLAMTDPYGYTPCFTEVLGMSANPFTVAEFYPVTTTGNPEITANIPSAAETAPVLSENLFCSGTVSGIEIPVPGTLRAYPNPASGSITVDAGELFGNQILEYKILNSAGQVVGQGEMVKRTTELKTDFLPGIYMLIITNKEGDRISGQKIIIH